MRKGKGKSRLKTVLRLNRLKASLSGQLVDIADGIVGFGEECNVSLELTVGFLRALVKDESIRTQVELLLEQWDLDVERALLAEKGKV